MNILLSSAAAAVFATATSAAFVLGMKVTTNDAKLFENFDKQRAAALAPACGSKGQLLQNPRTYAFSCVLTNTDGATVMWEVTEPPLLASRP